MRRGFKTWAENQSLRARRTCGIAPSSSLPARTLAGKLNVDLFAVNEIPELPATVVSQLLNKFGSNWSAATIPVDDFHIIVFNPIHLPARQESDIMHELAHILCGHTAETVRGPDVPFVLRVFNEEQEEEAKWLGGCLQVPRAALLWMVRRGYSSEAITEIFNASEEMVTYRRNITGIDKQLLRSRRWMSAIQN